MKSSANSKQLRQNQTEAEVLLWHHLRNRRFQNLKFRRQLPIGNYIVDFVCVSLKVIIELDGSQHMDNESYDDERTKFFESEGFQVIRFWNNEMLGQTDSVLESLRLILLNRAN